MSTSKPWAGLLMIGFLSFGSTSLASERNASASIEDLFDASDSDPARVPYGVTIDGRPFKFRDSSSTMLSIKTNLFDAGVSSIEDVGQLNALLRKLFAYAIRSSAPSVSEGLATHYTNYNMAILTAYGLLEKARSQVERSTAVAVQTYYPGETTAIYATTHKLNLAASWDIAHHELYGRFSQMAYLGQSPAFWHVFDQHARTRIGKVAKHAARTAQRVGMSVAEVTSEVYEQVDREVRRQLIKKFLKYWNTYHQEIARIMPAYANSRLALPLPQNLARVAPAEQGDTSTGLFAPTLDFVNAELARLFPNEDAEARAQIDVDLTRIMLNTGKVTNQQWQIIRQL